MSGRRGDEWEAGESEKRASGRGCADALVVSR